MSAGRGRPPLVAPLIAVVALVVTGCGTATSSPASSGAISPPLTHAAVLAGAGRSCVVPGSGPPKVAWSELENPILSSPIAGVKDEAIIWAGGLWHMLFGYVTNDPSSPGGVRWQVGTAVSTDLAHWSKPTFWPSQPGVIGAGGPDVARSPNGTFVVAFGTAGGTNGTANKSFYRTSTNLETWSAAYPLAPNMAPNPRDPMIDPVVAFTGHGAVLGFKVGSSQFPVASNTSGQAFEIAWSPSGSLHGPWISVGRPNIAIYGDTVEDTELFTVGGRWHLLAMSNTLDQPWLFTLSGNPSVPSGWLSWSDGRRLHVPRESWNSGPGLSSIGFQHANSAFLCNARASDGYYYLFYSGSKELTQFDGVGHAKIGVARSTDLVHWQVPPAGAGEHRKS
ncbi:MAG: glycoside hydrolase family protein [Acidimicrobiales bacterium]